MKLVFASGASGGHIFPAVAVAEEIRDILPFAEIVFVSSGRAVEGEIFRNVSGYRVVSLTASGAEGPPKRWSRWQAGFYGALAQEIRAALSFIRAERPDGVVGFGGKGSFAVVVAARLRGVPVLIHEQNVLPGLANRVLARFVNGVALSFEETRLKVRNRCVTGNPIRRLIERDCREEALRFFGFSPDKKTVLVLGGSQGAESVNTLFLEAAAHLPEELKKSLQVLHLCGKMKPDDSEAQLRAAGMDARSFSFFNRMDLAYGAADVAVGRAGATFLAEMEARCLPAVLIPYPYAGGHQLANARVVSGRSQARVAEQKSLNGLKLAGLLGELLDQPRALPSRERVWGGQTARRRLAQWIMEGVCQI